MANIEPIYQEIASKITAEQNKSLPRVIKKVANLQQARILRELPGTIDEITEKLSLSRAEVEKDLQYLYERGLALSGRSSWSLVNNLVLVKDLVGSANLKYDDDELFDLLHVMSLEDSDNLEERVKSGEKITVRQVMRVVPKWRTIKDIPGILPIEDAREIFKAGSPIVVHDCPCRHVYRERPCKGAVPLDVCLAVGSTARMYLRRGSGKVITYEELIALLDRLDDYPLVGMTGNSNRMPTVLCSCCADCCGLFVRAARTRPVLGKVTWAKSRFVIEDNPENCTACGICTDNRCPVNAITMKDFPELGGKRSYTDVDECIGCGLCVLTCPNDARKMKLVRPPSHIPDPMSMFDNMDRTE